MSSIPLGYSRRERFVAWARHWLLPCLLAIVVGIGTMFVYATVREGVNETRANWQLFKDMATVIRYNLQQGRLVLPESPPQQPAPPKK